MSETVVLRGPERPDLLRHEVPVSYTHLDVYKRQGMNRLGFTPDRYRSAWARLNALPQVDEISFMTHFSDADSAKGIGCLLYTSRCV